MNPSELARIVNRKAGGNGWGIFVSSMPGAGDFLTP